MELNQTYINIEDVNIYCEYSLQEGRPPLLFIHGVAATIYTFHALLPLLKDSFSIIAIDLPGFGKSDKSASFTYSFANYAKVVAGIIDYFKLENANLVGHSMGGQIALYTAKLFPEKVNKLVLISSSVYLKRAKKALVFCTYFPFFHYYVKYQVHKKEVREVLENVFYDHALITENHIEEFGKPLQEKGFYTALMRLLRHREGDLSSAELKTIFQPTLIIWGKEDKVVSARTGQQLVKDLSDARLIVYEKVGHLVTEERPKEVSEQISVHIHGKIEGK